MDMRAKNSSMGKESLYYIKLLIIYHKMTSTRNQEKKNHKM